MNTDEAGNTAYVRIDRVSKFFDRFQALKEVSLDIFQGEFVCFLGPSGCGKTTFLRAIAGLDIQTSGTIEQDGKDISALPPSERDFGIVFQSYALFPNLTVAKNVSFGLENRKVQAAEITKKVADLLELVGLSDQGAKYPAQLSGGQQQRVALARALATSPGLLLLDEPLSALDAKVRTYLRHEMKALQRRLGVTTIMVTHDQEEALTMADRIVVMNHGVIEQIGTPTEIYRSPQTLFVADFIGSMNQIPATVVDGGSIRIGELELSVNQHDFARDTSLIAAIRPENIRPVDKATDQPRSAEPGSDTPNRLVTRIREMEFLGSFWRVELENSAMGDFALSADFSINAVGRLDVAVDRFLEIELPVEHLLLFPS